MPAVLVESNLVELGGRRRGLGDALVVRLYSERSKFRIHFSLLLLNVPDSSLAGHDPSFEAERSGSVPRPHGEMEEEEGEREDEFVNESVDEFVEFAEHFSGYRPAATFTSLDFEK